MPSNDLFQPGDVFNGYVIEEPREQADGPIQCYFATDTRTNQPAMLHCLDRRPSENTPEMIERFNAMVARLRALDVWFAARLYDGGVTDRVYWAATEHVIGGGLTLDSILGDPEHRLPIPACFMLISQLASDLRKAHRAGVKHLRLHPSRVLLTREKNGIDKLLDIGIAELFSLSPAIMRLDPLYAAPEQLRDKGNPVDERADIYALGMIFYAMLAWVPPHADKDGNLPSKSKLLLLAMTQTPPLIGDRKQPFPDFLDVFVQSMIAKPRSNRPESWEAFHTELNDIVARWMVWCSTMDDLGGLEPAKRTALIAALRGPAPEGTELHMLIARLLDTTLLGPRARKPQKPQSGQRPSAALRAGMEGYCIEEEEGAEEGLPEPEWLASLPEDGEPASGETREPLALPEPPAPPAAVTSPSQDTGGPLVLPEPPAPPATLAVPSQATDEPGTPPPNAERHPRAADDAPHDTTRDPLPPRHLEPAITAPDGAPPEPVTLPSGHIAPQDAARRARQKRAPLMVAALFVCSLIALALDRGSPERPTVARSAALHSLRVLELPAAPAPIERNAPEPSASMVAPSAPLEVPSATARRTNPRPPLPPAPSTSASAEPEPPPLDPAASPVDERDEDPCKTFYCLPESK